MVELQVGAVEPRRVHPARGHGDHAPRRARAQGGEQQLGQRERAEDVRREGQLGAAGAALAALGQHAGVVDEHGEVGLALGQVGAQARDRLELGQVAERDAQVGGGAETLQDLVARALAALAVAHDQVDACSGASQALDSGHAKARARAGDHGRATVQPARHGVVPA